MDVLLLGESKKSAVHRVMTRMEWSIAMHNPNAWRWSIQSSPSNAVIVWTPIATRAEIVRFALLHQKHVLVRRPLSLIPAECRELERMAKDRGLCLMVDYGWLHGRLPSPGSWSDASIITFKRWTSRLQAEYLSPERFVCDHVAVLRHLVGHLRYFWECYFATMVGASIRAPRCIIEVSRIESICEVVGTWPGGRVEKVRLKDPTRYLPDVLTAFQTAIYGGEKSYGISSAIATALEVIEKPA